MEALLYEPFKKKMSNANYAATAASLNRESGGYAGSGKTKTAS